MLRIFLKKEFLFVMAIAFFSNTAIAGGNTYYEGEGEDPNKKILKSGLLGAATGAISAEASGGKAGTGALVGAGTNVIGGALLDSLTAPSPQPRRSSYPSGYAAPPPPQGYQQSYNQGYYVEQAPPPPQPVYYSAPPPREDPNKKILKSGLLGAGTGAIAASASGGKAGTGALVGAGTNVIGGALLDTLTTPSQPQQQGYYAPPPPPQGYYQSYPQQQQVQPQRKIIRKYDAEGNIIEEEEVYQ